jgi:predicted TIM-barrel fold metal-dependent hydrolase
VHSSERTGSAGWDCHVHVFDADRPMRGGHYQPVHRPLVDIEATAAALGVHHLVLVQPSVYGSDNRLLLQALAATPGRHRGVVVLADDVSDAELDAMHTAGVRGARLNLVSPVGEPAAVERRFDTLAPRLRARGWHLQWYAPAQQLPLVASLHAGTGLTCVIDHLGGLQAHAAAQDPAWAALDRLARDGSWIKLSGWYRLGASAPYDTLFDNVRRVARLFARRMVWGSDWPHTAFAVDAMPPYASTWLPVPMALGDPAAAELLHAQPAIYR